jgi:cell division protein FtsI (penicillin-binding protein 3)
MNIKKSILFRVRFTFLVLLLLSVAVVYKIFYLQNIVGDQYRDRFSVYKRGPLNAMRGNIYSDNGSLLATSLPYYRLAIDPTVVTNEKNQPSLDSLCQNLAGYFKTNHATYYKRMIKDAAASGKQYLLLSTKTKISHKDKQELMQWPIFRKGRSAGGVIFDKYYERFRPFGSLAQRTIGYVNAERVGKAGIEYGFNTELAGRDGEATFKKITPSFYTTMYDGTEIHPKNGLDVYSTLNLNIQDVAQASLEKHLKAWQAAFGCVVVMEVKTGEIKAMANFQLKDPNDRSSGYVDELNYAIKYATDPGSTFKLASYMALFEDGLIDVDTKVDASKMGFMKFGNGPKDTIWDHRNHGFGVISVKEAFAKSSNVAVAKLVIQNYKTDKARFLQRLSESGIAEPLNFQIPGESIPFVKRDLKEFTSASTLPYMSMGYEMRLTPLQILAFYNGVANGGKLIQPIIVKEVKRNETVVQKFEPKVIRSRMCSERTLAQLKVLLEAVVEEGTARNIKNDNYKIAGKTGTAQKLINGRYTKRYYTSFVGYFPADNPKYSCIVVIDDPVGYNKMAADVAAPVFKEIADKIYASDAEMHKEVELKHNNVPKLPHRVAGHHEDLKTVFNTAGISNHKNIETASFVVAKVNGNSIKWTDCSYTMGKMPDVHGMTLKDALYFIENEGYKVKYIGNGRVKVQSPAPHTKIEKGSTVYLRLG